MRRRVLILPIAAGAILSLVVYKEWQTPPATPLADVSPIVRRPAPSFQGLDPQNKLVKLQAYLGRHRILLAFFDRETGLEGDPGVQLLRQHFTELSDAGWIVLAVSDALPQQNRAAMQRGGAFPFPIISDPAFEAQKTWGRYDASARRTLPGLFFIDRAGRVDSQGGVPLPVDDAAATVEQIIHDT